MVEQMEFVDVEGIMSEIRTQNKVVVFIKRFIRKCVTFLIAPIVDAQNELNQYTASALVQIGAKFEQEQDYDYDEMQKKIEMLEQRIAELEKSVENNQ